MRRLSKVQRRVLMALAKGGEISVQRYSLQELCYVRMPDRQGGFSVRTNTMDSLRAHKLVEPLPNRPFGDAAYGISDKGRAAIDQRAVPTIVGELIGAWRRYMGEDESTDAEMSQGQDDCVRLLDELRVRLGL